MLPPQDYDYLQGRDYSLNPLTQSAIEMNNSDDAKNEQAFSRLYYVYKNYAELDPKKTLEILGQEANINPQWKETYNLAVKIFSEEEE